MPSEPTPPYVVRRIGDSESPWHVWDGKCADYFCAEPEDAQDIADILNAAYLAGWRARDEQGKDTDQ